MGTLSKAEQYRRAKVAYHAAGVKAKGKGKDSKEWKAYLEAKGAYLKCGAELGKEKA
jgi:hypothetical protein